MPTLEYNYNICVIRKIMFCSIFLPETKAVSMFTVELDANM
jgi:hypothetical protein